MCLCKYFHWNKKQQQHGLWNRCDQVDKRQYNKLNDLHNLIFIRIDLKLAFTLTNVYTL